MHYFNKNVVKMFSTSTIIIICSPNSSVMIYQYLFKVSTVYIIMFLCIYLELAKALLCQQCLTTPLVNLSIKIKEICSCHSYCLAHMSLRLKWALPILIRPSSSFGVLNFSHFRHLLRKFLGTGLPNLYKLGGWAH